MASKPTYEELLKRVEELEKEAYERKKSEDALRESEDKYKSLVESTEDSIYLVDKDCCYLFLNKKHLSRFVGLPIHKAIGRPYSTFHSKQETREFTQKVNEVFKTGKSLTYEYRSERDGGYYIRTLSPVISPAGRPTAVTVISKDITERKQAETELRRREEGLRIITDNIPGLVSYADAEGCYRFVNKQYEEWFGLSRKEIIGKHYKLILGNTTYKQIKKYVEEALSGKQVQYEEALPYKSGGTRWVHADYVPDIDEQGNVKGFFALVADITEKKQAIDQIVRHNRELAILNKITASVSSSLDLYKILEAALDAVLEIAGIETGSIYVMDHQAKELVLATYRGVSNEFAQQVCTFKMGESLTGRVAQSGEPIVADDIVTDRRVTTLLARKEGIHSFAAIPMKSKGKVQGVICIASHEHHQFIHEEIQLYLSIADHIGIAIENARLYEQMKQEEKALRASEEQKESILDASIDQIRLSDTDMRIIWANQTHARDLNVDPEDIVGKTCYEVFVGRNSPCPECPAQKALKSGKTEHTILVRPLKGNADEKTYLDSYAEPIRDESGRIVHVLQVTRDITEKVLAEKNLQKSEEHYRELADSITDVFFAMDTNLRYTHWNKTSEELTGIPATEAIGKFLLEIFPDNPETRKAEGAYREVLKTRTSKTFLNEYTLKGKRYFFDITAYPSRDGLSVFARDISKQKEMELAFWESEERYRILFDGIPMGLYRTTPEGKVLDANRALIEIMGYPDRETALRANARESYVNSKDREFFQETIEKQGAIYGFETQLYRYDGTPVWVEINARVVKSADGKILHYEGSMADITERKHAEEVIGESQENLKRAQQIGHLGNWDWNVKNEILIWSDEVYRIYGVGKDFPLTYENIEAMIHPDDCEKNQIKVNALLSTADAVKFEFRIIRPDGTVRHIYQNAEASRDEAGTVNRIFGIIHDITERKQIEEEVRRSQEQLRSLADHLQSVRENERTTIAREIHDELGQALTGLKMDISWMAKRIPEDQTQLLDKLHSMSELTGITLRTVQRISTALRPGLLDDLGLVAAIEWQTEEFQNRTGIRCTLTVEPEDITADGRRSTALFRILQESLNNVFRHASATRVAVSLKEKDGQIIFRVRDNGKGITKEQISSNLSFGIMGMCERVHQFQGRVRISGSPGKGTTVVVRMPVKD